MNEKPQDLKNDRLHVAVRTEDQASALASPGVTVIRADLRDEHAVKAAILRYESEIATHHIAMPFLITESS
jgi:hypothetical protein